MKIELFKELYAGGFISGASLEKIKLREQGKYLSVHWEIKTLLYLGVVLLSSGLGILVYKNIDTIGHQVIVLFIALLCMGCFLYCVKRKVPFSTGKVVAPNAYFDYILLLGCCTFISLVAYLQFQYNLFGNRYGLALFFPMVMLFFSAYFFDHLGILSLAIVNLAAWLGITITPLDVLNSNNFNDSTLIFTGLALGILLLVVAGLTKKKNIKPHFEFTYANFGTHLVLITCIAAMIHFYALYLAWFIVLIAMVYLFYRKAMRDRSFYFILILTLYAYIGLSYVVLHLLNKMTGADMGPLYLGSLYFIISGIGLVLFLMRTNKKMKTI